MSFLDFLFSRPQSKQTVAAREHHEPVVYESGEHNISRKFISENALKVLSRLQRAGFEAYLVGGAVRDILLEREPKDFDVATDATPEEIRDLFRNSRLIGRRFRLAHVHFRNEVIEVATFRAGHEGDEDGAQVDAKGRILRDNVYGSLDEDAWRRDFTVNALYYDARADSVVDYVGGVEDIRDRRLQLIGDVNVRFHEDPVRMLRAVRFAAKLNLEIDPQVASAITELGGLLSEIAPARLFDETLKLFHAGTGYATFVALQEFDLYRYLIPVSHADFESNESGYRLIEEALRNTDARVADGKSVNPAFIFAAFLWGPTISEVNRLVAEGRSNFEALSQASDHVIGAQIKRVAVPRRLTTVVRDIWFMQSKLESPKPKRVSGLLANPRFRAAYDFLLLRERAGENLNDIGQWWTELQSADENSRRDMVGTLKPSAPRRRPRKRRRRSQPQPQ